MGYERCYQTFLRTIRRFGGVKPRKKPKNPKPYQRAEYPGQKIQIDVKYVPAKRVAYSKKYYQYTAAPAVPPNVRTYSSKLFLEEALKYFSFPVHEAQTDNGSEFTNALFVVKAKHKTLFEQALADMGINYNRIRVATPRHNGKVERQHRKDE